MPRPRLSPGGLGYLRYPARPLSRADRPVPRSLFPPHGRATFSTSLRRTMIHASHLHGTPLLSRLGAHALASPSAIAITSHARSTTYSQLCSDVLFLALRLLSSGSRARGVIGGSDLKESRVAILCEKGYLFPLSLLATWAAGGMALPVLTSLPMAEQSFMVNNAEVGMIVCDQTNRARADDLAQELQAGRGVHCPVVELDEGLEGIRGEAGGDEAADRLRRSAEWTRDLKLTDGDRRAMMLYTSGTVSGA